jgi:hypothetical protein
MCTGFIWLGTGSSGGRASGVNCEIKCSKKGSRTSSLTYADLTAHWSTVWRADLTAHRSTVWLMRTLQPTGRQSDICGPYSPPVDSPTCSDLTAHWSTIWHITNLTAHRSTVWHIRTLQSTGRQSDMRTLQPTGWQSDICGPCSPPVDNLTYYEPYSPPIDSLT